LTLRVCLDASNILTVNNDSAGGIDGSYHRYSIALPGTLSAHKFGFETTTAFDVVWDSFQAFLLRPGQTYNDGAGNVPCPTCEQYCAVCTGFVYPDAWQAVLADAAACNATYMLSGGDCISDNYHESGPKVTIACSGYTAVRLSISTDGVDLTIRVYLSKFPLAGLAIWELVIEDTTELDCTDVTALEIPYLSGDDANFAGSTFTLDSV
jgi:hypothetical protein